jgi:sn-glycerol 3-phosphate transport system permease protein
MNKKVGVISWIVLLLGAVVVLFPLVFSLLLSLSSPQDIFQGNYIPASPSLNNYIEACQTEPLFHYMFNSLVVGLITSFLQILIALPAAYAIVFLHIKGRKLIFAFIMATMMIPAEVLVVCNFQTIRSWNLLNTFAGLILPGVASTFGIFLIRQNMLQIPYELREAAVVAGISDFQFLVRIAIPMIRNAIVTLAIYYFLVSWNSYMWPLLSTTDETVRTIQIGLRQLKNIDAGDDFCVLAAGAMLSTIPTLILIFFGQKRLQDGMSRGSLK